MKASLPLRAVQRRVKPAGDTIGTYLKPLMAVFRAHLLESVAAVQNHVQKKTGPMAKCRAVPDN
jgi:hypothetical protein